MLKLSRPAIDETAISAVAEVLRSGQLVYGEQGARFETQLKEFLGVRHALVVSSGTAALHLALLALEIGPGDAVFVPDFSFPATGNVVCMVGARPVLVDVDPNSYCMCPAALEAAISAWRGPEIPRALIPVHEFGHAADMTKLMAIAARHDLTVIEDAACALGASHNGQPCGTFGNIGCWSMHPRKTLTTGEGGILASNDELLAIRLGQLRNHGMVRTEQGTFFERPGLNLRLTDIQSALGLALLPRLTGWISHRRWLADTYGKLLAPLAKEGLLSVPASAPGHSWQTYMIVLRRELPRDDIIRGLKNLCIETNLGAQSLAAQPAFRNFPPDPDTCHSRMLYQRGLALPFCESYGVDEAMQVVAALSKVLGMKSGTA